MHKHAIRYASTQQRSFSSIYLVIQVIEVLGDKDMNVSHDLQHVQPLLQLLIWKMNLLKEIAVFRIKRYKTRWS